VAMATMQFAIRDLLADFLVRHPKVNVVAHATDRNVDIVGENYNVAIRAHSDGRRQQKGAQSGELPSVGCAHPVGTASHVASPIGRGIDVWTLGKERARSRHECAPSSEEYITTKAGCAYSCGLANYITRQPGRIG
jgi:DNA-binding transcriptional LysR family regulator